MQRIPIKFATAGMSLSKPVSRADGMVLAGENTVLTDAIIDRFKNAGIPSVAVKGRPMPGLSSGMDLVKVKERIPHLFRKYQDDKLMMTLRNMLEQYLERAIQDEEEGRRAEMSGQTAQGKE